MGRAKAEVDNQGNVEDEVYVKKDKEMEGELEAEAANDVPEGEKEVAEAASDVPAEESSKDDDVNEDQEEVAEVANETAVGEQNADEDHEGENEVAEAASDVPVEEHSKDDDHWGWFRNSASQKNDMEEEQEEATEPTAAAE